MDSQLNARRIGAGHEGGEVFRVHQGEAGRVRAITIGRDQQRAAATKRTVHIELHGAIGDRVGFHLATGGNVEAIFAQRIVEPDRQATLCVELCHEGNFLRSDAHIVTACPAARSIESRAGLKRGLEPVGIGHREQWKDKPHCIVDEESVGGTVRIALDATTFRIRGVL